MLNLDDLHWNNLTTAYGRAGEIPNLIETIRQGPVGSARFNAADKDLWSSLCHQSDVYTASYAALPHLVMICGDQPEMHWSPLQLSVCIEIGRLTGRGPALPKKLSLTYHHAISSLPATSLEMLKHSKEEDLISISAAAIAVSNGFPRLAAAYLELESRQVDAFLDWSLEN